MKSRSRGQSEVTGSNFEKYLKLALHDVRGHGRSRGHVRSKVKVRSVGQMDLFVGK